jgi:hypothetical protein
MNFSQKKCNIEYSCKIGTFVGMTEWKWCRHSFLTISAKVPVNLLESDSRENILKKKADRNPANQGKQAREHLRACPCSCRSNLSILFYQGKRSSRSGWRPICTMKKVVDQRTQIWPVNCSRFEELRSQIYAISGNFLGNQVSKLWRNYYDIQKQVLWNV